MFKKLNLLFIVLLLSGFHSKKEIDKWIKEDISYLKNLYIDIHKNPEISLMEKEEKKSLATFLSDDEVKIVWREDSNLDKPPKVGRGKIMNDDDNFVYLSGEKGTVIVNKKDIIAVKQLPK